MQEKKGHTPTPVQKGEHVCEPDDMKTYLLLSNGARQIRYSIHENDIHRSTASRVTDGKQCHSMQKEQWLITGS